MVFFSDLAPKTGRRPARFPAEKSAEIRRIWKTGLVADFGDGEIGMRKESLRIQQPALPHKAAGGTAGFRAHDVIQVVGRDLEFAGVCAQRAFLPEAALHGQMKLPHQNGLPGWFRRPAFFAQQTLHAGEENAEPRPQDFRRVWFGGAEFALNLRKRLGDTAGIAPGNFQ